MKKWVVIILLLFSLAQMLTSQVSYSFSAGIDYRQFYSREFEDRYFKLENFNTLVSESSPSEGFYVGVSLKQNVTKNLFFFNSLQLTHNTLQIRSRSSINDISLNPELAAASGFTFSNLTQSTALLFSELRWNPFSIFILSAGPSFRVNLRNSIETFYYSGNSCGNTPCGFYSQPIVTEYLPFEIGATAAISFKIRKFEIIVRGAAGFNKPLSYSLSDINNETIFNTNRSTRSIQFGLGYTLEPKS